MKIFTISGSANKGSINQRLLYSLANTFTQHQFTHFDKLMDFPLFTPSRGEKPTALVNEFKEKLKEAELVIISTPEYLHNIPAVLKNAFEFVTTSGEFFDKRVLVITYTPHAPRGEKAMLSLLASLDALKTKVVAQLPLYQSELRITDDNTFTGDEESIEALKAVFEFLQ